MIQKILSDLSACDPAITWAQGKSFYAAWQECKRADWMLWLCGRMADWCPGWPKKQELIDFCKQYEAYPFQWAWMQALETGDMNLSGHLGDFMFNVAKGRAYKNKTRIEEELQWLAQDVRNQVQPGELL